MSIVEHCGEALMSFSSHLAGPWRPDCHTWYRKLYKHLQRPVRCVSSYTSLIRIQKPSCVGTCLLALSALKSRECMRDVFCSLPTDLIVVQKKVCSVCSLLIYHQCHRMCWNCSKSLYTIEIVCSHPFSIPAGSFKSISSDASKCTHTGSMSRPVSADPNLTGLVSLLHHVCLPGEQR